MAKFYVHINPIFSCQVTYYVSLFVGIAICIIKYDSMCSIVGIGVKIIYTLVRALQLYEDLSIASQRVLLFFIALIHSLRVTKNTWQKLLSKFLGLNYLWVT